VLAGGLGLLVGLGTDRGRLGAGVGLGFGGLAGQPGRADVLLAGDAGQQDRRLGEEQDDQRDEDTGPEPGGAVGGEAEDPLAGLGEDDEDEDVEMISLECPACETQFETEDTGERPLRATCPGCGASGKLDV